MGDWLDTLGLGDQFDPRLCFWPPVPVGMASDMAFLRESIGGWAMTGAEIIELAKIVMPWVVFLGVIALLVWGSR